MSTKKITRELAGIRAGIDGLQSAPERATDRAADARDVARAARSRKPYDPTKLPITAHLRLFVGGGKATHANAVRARRAFPIMGFVGPNGGGKSLCMLDTTLPSIYAGRKIVSTVRVIDPRTGQTYRNYERLEDFSQLLDLEHADVLFDEVVGIANSRSAQSLPVQVQNLLVQLRRRDLNLRWTAPNWARADKIIREVTQAVTECRGFHPGRSLPNENGDVAMWAPKRVFNFRTFDTLEFEEWSAGKRDGLRPVAAEWFRGIGSEAFKAYDTMDAVSMVSSAIDDDRCSICGEKKRATYCKGHAGEHPHDHEEMPSLGGGVSVDMSTGELVG